MTNSIAAEQAIRIHPLFENVEDGLLQRVIGAVTEEQLSSGDVVFEDESDGTCCYLLASGKVKITKLGKTGSEILLGVLRDGDLFGELDLIDRLARSATATALTDCQLFRIGKVEFELLLTSSRQFAVNMLRMLSFRLRTSNYIYVLREETNILRVDHQVARMKHLLESAKVLNSSLDLETLIGLILKTAEQTVDADRGTVYVIDEAKKELWSLVQEGARTVKIRLPLGKGIAGFVGQSGETVNLADVYQDPRFHPDVDKVTGYKTKSMLCMPMKNKDGKVIGVFQLLNKKNTSDGVFTSDDESLMEALSIHAAIAVENAQTAQAMVQNERLSAVGKMASSIIHDIKNPMGVLRLSAQVIRRKSPDAEIQQISDEMMRQIDRFVAMSQEILDFSRGVNAVNIEDVSVPEFMETARVVLANDLASHNVAVTTKIEYKGLMAVDQEKMMRVFYNLATNARDAMPNGGTLTIGVDRREYTVVIEFTDTGVGMPAEIRSRVFEPFVTHGKRYGTGLGMAIVKKVVDDHKGSIEIDSEEGKGTSVRILIPLFS
jgi:K+-sensing histidine kinase KdpD